MRTLALALVAALAPVPPTPMRVVDVAQVRRIPETSISADGRHVAFVVDERSVADNTTTSRLMIDDRTVATVDRATGIQWGPTAT
jgi:hypothetical protein